MKAMLFSYVEIFFDTLIISTAKNPEAKKDYLAQSIFTFLDDETKETAFQVYDIFFGAYHIALAGAKNPFIDLLDTLRCYEERCRDTHREATRSFCPFGQRLYSRARNLRRKPAGIVRPFSDAVIDGKGSPENLPTAQEEFLFRWGIAALFHDVGYPVEIISKPNHAVSKVCDRCGSRQRTWRC